MREYIKEIRNHSILMSILGIVLGFSFTVNPKGSLSAIVIVVAILGSVNGIWYVIDYFRRKKNNYNIPWLLIKGVMLIIVSIFIVLNPEKVIDLVYIIAGVWIIVEAIFKLQIVAGMWMHLENKVLLILLFILEMLLGIFVIIHPGFTGEMVMMISGIILMVSEIYNLVIILYVSSKAKNAFKNIDKIVKPSEIIGHGKYVDEE